MKYCPYCGASLPGSAVSYCAECGKALPRKAGQRTPSRPAERKTRRPAPDRPEKKARPPKAMPVKKLLDENYDGYYDDVLPVDTGWERERVDTGLVRRIILLVLGALGMISLAILMMALL